MHERLVPASLRCTVRSLSTNQCFVLLAHFPKASFRWDSVYFPVHTMVCTGASLEEQLEIARFLLSCNATPRVASTLGQTPLHQAAGRGNVAIVKLLLEANGENLASVLLDS